MIHINTFPGEYKVLPDLNFRSSHFLRAKAQRSLQSFLVQLTLHYCLHHGLQDIPQSLSSSSAIATLAWILCDLLP